MSDNQKAAAGAAGTRSYATARYAAAWQDRRRRTLVLKAVQFAFFVMVVAFAHLSLIPPSGEINSLLADALFTGWLASIASAPFPPVTTIKTNYRKNRDISASARA